jgi:Flp pilus assembly protein TadG
MSALPTVHSRRNERGISTIEFAICAPVLLLLLLGTAEVGRLLFQYNTLMKTVRDGARYAAGQAAVGSTRVIDLTPQRILETQNLVVTGNTAGAGAPLLPGLVIGNVNVSDAANGFVRVNVEYVFEPVVDTLPSFGFGDGIDLNLNLDATVVMRGL